VRKILTEDTRDFFRYRLPNGQAFEILWGAAMNNPFSSEDFDMQDIRGDQYAVFPPVRNWLRFEGLGYLALALCVYQALGYSWIQFAIWILLPELPIVAYFFGNARACSICTTQRTAQYAQLCWEYWVFCYLIQLLCKPAWSGLQILGSIVSSVVAFGFPWDFGLPILGCFGIGDANDACGEI
jgi:hypothetical protein